MFFSVENARNQTTRGDAPPARPAAGRRWGPVPTGSRRLFCGTRAARRSGPRGYGGARGCRGPVNPRKSGWSAFILFS